MAEKTKSRKKRTKNIFITIKTSRPVNLRKTAITKILGDIPSRTAIITFKHGIVGMNKIICELPDSSTMFGTVRKRKVGIIPA